MSGIFRAVVLVISMLVATPSFGQGFLSSPLDCANPSCSIRYDQGVYTAGMMNTVLDHSMKQNRTGAWQYGTTANEGGDGVVVAFNGERASGRTSSDPTCIGGTIYLKPTPSSPASTAMVNSRGCGPGYASYDEHPGYDYRAAVGTPVKAAASGTVVDVSRQRCIINNMGRTCDDWGLIGIDHGNGYISQYGHLSRIDFAAGARVRSGDVVGLSGDRGVPGAPHLHFEVLRKVGSTYYVVDPYGWVGAGADPLYSARQAGTAKLWR